MAIPQYLAMTAAEMQGSLPLPEKCAWMACHFSPYSTGLCNLPSALPPGSLLIFNDRTPIHGHDPARICRELNEALEGLDCAGLLLDFQNPPSRESQTLVAYLEEHLQFPMGISPKYSVESAAVFAPPVPTDTPIADYLARWRGRSVWLEAALEGQTILLTASGAQRSTSPSPPNAPAFADEALHCHYSIEEKSDAVAFYTWRTQDDLSALLEEAEHLDVKLSVGLYQELSMQYRLT